MAFDVAQGIGLAIVFGSIAYFLVLVGIAFLQLVVGSIKDRREINHMADKMGISPPRHDFLRQVGWIAALGLVYLVGYAARNAWFTH